MGQYLVPDLSGQNCQTPFAMSLFRTLAHMHWCQIRIGLWVSRLVLPQIARKKNIIFRRRKNENWSRNWAMGGIINSLELHLWDAAVAAVQWHIAMGVAKVPRGCISRERCGDGVWSASSYLTFEAGIIAGYMNALYALHHIVLGFWPKKMQSSSLWDKLNVQPVLKMDEVDPKQLHKAFYIGVNIFYNPFHQVVTGNKTNLSNVLKWMEITISIFRQSAAFAQATNTGHQPKQPAPITLTTGNWIYGGWGGGERGVGGWGVKKIARMLQLSSLSLCTIGSRDKEKEKGCCIET